MLSAATAHAAMQRRRLERVGALTTGSRTKAREAFPDDPLAHASLRVDSANEPIIWDDAGRSRRTIALAQGLRQGSKSSAPKGHGTCERGVQRQLRWGCDREVSDRICCYNRRFAEHPGYWASTRLRQMRSTPLPPSSAVGGEPLTFFDSVYGLPCYHVGGAGRSWSEFERESCSRLAELPRLGVNWQHVRVLHRTAKSCPPKCI